MLKKSSLAEMRKEYMSMPITANTLEVDGVLYTVVSHFVGSKNIDAVVRDLAERQAYEDMKTKET